jgi:predicted ATPase
MTRLDQAGPAKEAAQIGAVIGRDFSATLLRAVWPGHDAALDAALETLTTAGLVHRLADAENETYAFKHALLQEAAYGSLLHSSRRRYHERIASALASWEEEEEAEVPPEILAHHCTEAGLTARAIPYWVQAGQRSTERSAHLEAIRSLQCGLDCVAKLPDGDERRVRELGIRTLLGANLLAVRGYTAPEVSANCERSLALLAGVEDSPQVRPVVWALWLHHLVLADRDVTRLLAEQFETAADGADDEAQCRAQVTHAITSYWQGEFERTRGYAAESRARYHPAMRRTLPLYGDDMGPYGYIYEGMALWFQGRPDQARPWVEKGLAVARESRYAFSIAAALSFATQLEQLGRDAAATEALAERAIAYCQEQGFPLYLAAALAHRGWARAMQGDVPRGLEDLAAGVGLYRLTGAILNVNYLLGLQAEVHWLNGDRASGLAAADEGLALAAGHLDTYFVAELHRIRAALLLLGPAEPAAAEAALRDALAVADRQGAAELGLRAAVALGRLLVEQGRMSEARALLTGHVARGRVAGERPDLRDAQTVLAALG